MEREHRYYVAKTKDVEKYLSDEQQLSLDRFLTKIRIGRLNDGKADVKTVCVDSDWPEYETVWKMIEARVDGKASPASAPVAAPDYRIADRGFRWDAETRQHIPQLLIEFTPVPANAPNDSNGWKDRDSLAAMLAAAPATPVSEDRKDAERYLWLRASDFDIFGSPHAIHLSGKELDQAIDAAMYGEVK